MKNNDINITLNQPSAGGKSKPEAIASTVKGVTDSIANASWKRIIKVYFVAVCFVMTAIAGLFAYKLVSDEEAVKRAAINMTRTQKEENLRESVVTPKIQHELKVLVYSLGADRAFIFELHNGKKNGSGLPFKYVDMTYEEANETKKADKVAMMWQNIPLSLYRYPHYLQEKKMIFSTVDDISKVDPDFANNIRQIGGKYLAMAYMSSDGTPIGFLCVSFHDMSSIPPQPIIESKLKMYDKMFTQLLDLRVQMELN